MGGRTGPLAGGEGTPAVGCVRPLVGVVRTPPTLVSVVVGVSSSARAGIHRRVDANRIGSVLIEEPSGVYHSRDMDDLTIGTDDVHA